MVENGIAGLAVTIGGVVDFLQEGSLVGCLEKYESEITRLSDMVSGLCGFGYPMDGHTSFPTVAQAATQTSVPSSPSHSPLPHPIPQEVSSLVGTPLLPHLQHPLPPSNCILLLTPLHPSSLSLSTPSPSHCQSL